MHPWDTSQTTNLKKIQCLNNGNPCQELSSSYVHFPIKLGNSGLDGQMSAFQGPCSTAKLSTTFLNCKHSIYSAKMILTLQSTGQKDVPHVTW